MKGFRIIIISLLAVLAGVACLFGYRSLHSPQAKREKIETAKVSDMKEMLRLSSVEIYEDIPVRGKIGSRHLVARLTVVGSIAFDLDSIQYSETADSIFVTLPREVVEIRESTDPGSYKVIDNWNDRLLGSSNFTAAEENAIKLKARDNFIENLYRRGLVSRARREASENLSAMLGSLSGKTVVVLDTPEGDYVSH